MASSPVTAPSPNHTTPANSPPPSSSSSPPPPSSPPPAPPTSPPPAPHTSPPPSSSPPAPSTPPPKQSPSPPPPTPSGSQTPPLTGSPPASPLPSDSSPPPPTSSVPSHPAPPTGTPPTPGNTVFSPPPPVPGQTPASPSTTLSPPPPHTSPPPQRSPPSSSKSPSSSSSDAPTTDSSSPNVAIIAGIAVAGILILAFVIVCVACTRRKKRKPYHPGPGPKGGEYYGSQEWQSPRPLDHIVKLPPPPGVMGTPVGGVGSWGAPPPPPAANTSSDFSSGLSGQPHTPHTPLPPSSPNMGLGGFGKSQFTYEELAAATNGFSQANLLGQGGFGYVHKGVLPNGQEVAVKSLKSGSGQGEREFQAEVEIISRVHHRHLVSLVGYCIGDGQRMLVYEFVPNKTMEFHLHGKGQPVMDWATRLRIALGSAKGLGYLHEDCHPRIIHRDIKAANILLDYNFEAMVADFGLAKLTSDNYTHVSTRVMGTFGYLAPEYASSGKLTEKSDVFSFGVMLLELITGRRPVDPTSKFMEDSLVDWARPLLAKALEDGMYDELVDPPLEENYVPHEMARMVACASASIRHSARRRPRMSQIVSALVGDLSLENLSEGTKPGQGAVQGSNGSSDTGSYDTGAYNADMMKFRKMVMNSQEFASSEYGATSEYGLNPSSSSSDSRETGGHSGLQRQKL
ncbi:hypothetical protein RJ639_034227 [Escallonia herrerae]|uniref:non-specific serine/threonine protein kinase n=1 Tax=Escallonia herrerae TaxID=1293975 RepID=A0AA89B8H2_9ASTE|nr:hypothetical protein RJ639_034227 [Escallonia herrerae]